MSTRWLTSIIIILQTIFFCLFLFNFGSTFIYLDMIHNEALEKRNVCNFILNIGSKIFINEISSKHVSISPDKIILKLERFFVVRVHQFFLFWIQIKCDCDYNERNFLTRHS